MGKRQKLKLSLAEKIELSTPILESKNKNYSKIKHAGKVKYISRDKLSGVNKVLSVKQFRNLKKIVDIRISTDIIKQAYTSTNMDNSTGLRTDKHLYKPYKDIKNKKRYLQIDTKTGNVLKSFSFKQGLHIFRTIKAEQDIKLSMSTYGINRKEAEERQESKQIYLKENQITKIMQDENVNRNIAENIRYNLTMGRSYKRTNGTLINGGMNTLINKYTSFTSDSSYNTVG